VATLMKKIGIEAIYKKPDTSRRRPKHPVCPYLLRDLGDRSPQPDICGRLFYVVLCSFH
jgi:putative transposase